MEVVGFAVRDDEVKQGSVMIPRFLVSVSEYISHEIERRLLFGRKAMTNLDSLLKSRDTTLPTKVSPIVTYGCESWTTRLSVEELIILNCGVGEDS